MTTSTINFLDQFKRSSVVSKAWRTKEPVDEITLGWWSTQQLISFALDYDSVSALPPDDQYAVMIELARRLEKTMDDEETQD